MRDLVNAHLRAVYLDNKGVVIRWKILLPRYPVSGNRQSLAYAGLASQNNNYALYPMYGSGDSQFG